MMPPRILPREIIQSLHPFSKVSRIPLAPLCSRSFLTCNAHIRKLQWPPHPSLRAPQRRIASITPVTTVNAQKNIPSEYEELYNRLVELRTVAANQVNLSQVQLALRGLESRDGVTRVAVLGVTSAIVDAGESPDTGRTLALRLVRSLLADPLSTESSWEKSLEKDVDQDGRGLLIRYGEEYQHDIQQPQLRIISIPSTTLLKHNLEFIVHTTIYDQSATSENDAERLLLPTLSIPISTSGRETEISYPVHKTIIVGGGIEGIVACSRIQDDKGPDPDTETLNRRMILKVVDVPWETKAEETRPSSSSESSSRVNLINLAQTESAIAHFRKSIEDSSAYATYQSNIESMSSWLTAGTSLEYPLKPSISDLIHHIVSTATCAINVQQIELQKLSLSTIPQSTLQELSAALSTWSQNAHTDLQLSLEEAFSSRSPWRKLAWWKLSWRIDDVEMITADILQRSWLVEAEKELLWLAGRLTQAGLVEDKSYAGGTKSSTLAAKKRSEDSEGSYGTVPDSPPYYIPPAPSHNPTPNTIQAARTTLLDTTVPSLTATAQSLLLYSLSTITLTSTFSILTYISVSTQTIYETGAIASLGLVWALRRLQVRWERARKEWEQGVREDGRVVLRNLEEILRKLIENGGVPREEVGAEERREVERARGAVGLVREELDRVVGKTKKKNG